MRRAWPCAARCCDWQRRSARLTGSRRVLAELADAVADGEAVDWESVARGLPAGAAYIAHNLRAVQTLKSVPRAHATSRQRSARLADIPWWLGVLAFVVTAQVAMAAGSLVSPGVSLPQRLTWMLILTAVTYVAAALFLLHGGVSDVRALWLAAFLFSVGSAPAMPAIAWLRGAGPPIVWLRALHPEAFVPLFLFGFVRVFPQIVHRSASDLVLKVGLLVAAGVGLALFVANAILGIWPAAYRTPLAAVARTGELYWPTIVGLTLLAMAVAVWRIFESAGDERRRASFLLTAVVLGCAPGFSLILLEYLVPAIDLLVRGPVAMFYGDLFVYLPLLAIPPAAVHAVRTRRVLGVDVVLHQAIRHAMAVRAARVTVVASAALLLGHAMLHRRLTLDALLSLQPAPLLLAGAALAGAFLLIRPLLLNLPNRPGGDGGRLLVPEFARNVSSARTPQEVFAVLTDHADRGLGTEGCVVLVRGAESRGFLPIGSRARTLTDDSALLTLVTADSSPLRVDPLDGESVFRWLPVADQEWVVDADMALLVALGDADGRTGGVLGVPRRASGATFAAQDLALAGALASSASLAMRGWERMWLPERALAQPDSPAAECRACGRVSATDDEDCACGGRLFRAVLPVEVNGRFRVDAVLGRGGMGVVYRGTDLALGRPVALKTLPRAGAEPLLRLRQEARSMARFIHPHLALIFGSESWRGVPILVVECLEGGTLAHRLGAPLPIREVVEWGFHLAGALEAMHGKGLLHRDVKPSNIGFTDEGVPKLLDFGLARLVEEFGEMEVPSAAPSEAASAVTQAYHVLGTPRYLSPEALDGAAPSPAQDTWALFVVMWEAIAGRHPSDGRRAGLLAARPDCPALVAEVIDAGLQDDPQRRIATAGEARRRLGEALRS